MIKLLKNFGISAIITALLVGFAFGLRYIAMNVEWGLEAFITLLLFLAVNALVALFIYD